MAVCGMRMEWNQMKFLSLSLMHADVVERLSHLLGINKRIAGQQTLPRQRRAKRALQEALMKSNAEGDQMYGSLSAWSSEAVPARARVLLRRRPHVTEFVITGPNDLHRL
jgi:hypothetical protein